MAYGTKYKAGWSSRGGVSGYLYIDEEDYTGAEVDVKLKGFDKSALRLSHKLKNWESPLVGKTLSFSIVNDFSDFYTLLPLMTAYERKYRVRLVIITPSALACTLFQGYLNVEAISQKMIEKKELHLVASSYLSKLNNFYTSMVDSVQNVFFINLIDSILADIGTYNIRVNCSLHEAGVPLSSGHTLFNLKGINTEVFWVDNITRKNNMEILEMILVPLNAFLYWEDGYWYIERFSDIWDTSPSYVEYTTGSTYNYTTGGTVVNRTRSSADVHSLVFTNQSQNIKINPGYNQVKFNLHTDNHILFNLTSPVYDMISITDIDDIHAGDSIYPDRRTWAKWADDSYQWVVNTGFNDIKNCISKYLVGSDLSSANYYKGLFTRFVVEIPNSSTQLNIEWKYGLKDISFDPDDYTFKIHWVLKVNNGSYYIVRNASSGDFERVSTDDAGGINTEEVSGEDFDNTNKDYKVSLNIPLGTISGLDTNEDFVLYIGVVQVLDDSDVNQYFSAYEVIGDVIITVNDSVIDIPNEMLGGVNTLFLNKKEIDIDILDVDKLNYSNSILKSSTLSQRTTSWTIDDSTTHTLMEWLMIDKFRMYYASKQKITGDVYYAGVFAPFMLFTDSKQSDKKFLLTSYTYYPIFDAYNLTLDEYDNDLTINLV